MTNTYKGGNCCDGAGGKPSLGFTVSPEHKNALGHFAQEKFLREGHNTGPYLPGDKDRGMRPPPVFSAVATRDKQGMVSKNVDKLGAVRARAAIKSGNAAVASERPVLAARIAAKSAGASRKDTRAAVKTARADPNSRRSERKARRGARAGAAAAAAL
jgi:hypothetical protein